MKDQPIRVGVIGCGAQGQNHLRIIMELGAEVGVVRAFCDLSPDRLRNAKRLGPRARAMDDFEKMLASDSFDLVIVTTMPDTHARITLAALESGVDVLCEKPFMRNIEEARVVLNAAEQLGCQVQLGTNMRYMPTSRYLLITQWCQAKSGLLYFVKLGDVTSIHLGGGLTIYLASSAGGVLASTLIHALDLAIWVGGSPNPVSVSASIRRLFPGKRGPLPPPEVKARFNVEDLFAALVRFDNGSTYILEGNWRDDSPPPHCFEMITTKGKLNSEPFTVTVDENEQVVDKTPKLQENIGWGESVRNQDTDIIQRLREGHPWSMRNPRQLLNLQKLIDGCYESAKTEREIIF